MSEKTVDQKTVREEHLAEVEQLRQWLILAGVIGGGTVLMLLFIALLGGTG